MLKDREDLWLLELNSLKATLGEKEKKIVEAVGHADSLAAQCKSLEQSLSVLKITCEEEQRAGDARVFSYLKDVNALKDQELQTLRSQLEQQIAEETGKFDRVLTEKISAALEAQKEKLSDIHHAEAAEFQTQLQGLRAELETQIQLTDALKEQLQACSIPVLSMHYPCTIPVLSL